MPIDPKTSADVLIQYPLAGVIVVLVMVFLWFLRDWAKGEREARAAEAKADRESRASEQKAMRDFIAVQNELFLQSVKDIRDQHNASIGRLAEELKHNTAKLSELHGVLLVHDAASKERVSLKSR